MSETNDSLLKSSLRSFFKAFCGVFGFLISLTIFAFLLGSFKGVTPTSLSSVKMSIEKDANGEKLPLSSNAPVILQVSINGFIGDHKLNADLVDTQLSQSQSGSLKKRVKGVLLKMNTPGGNVSDSYTIYELIKKYKEKYKVPVYAHVDGLCASGGIYISSAVDKTFATDISIIGSVGVIAGPALNFVDLLESYGVKIRTTTAGKNKGMLFPFADWNKDSDESIAATTKYLYNHFVDVVVTNHPKISRELLINKYGANVFSAPEAEKIGFINHSDTSYDKALSQLAIDAGISEQEKYQVIEFKPVRSVIQEALELKSNFTKIVNLFSGKPAANPYPYLYLYSHQ